MSLNKTLDRLFDEIRREAKRNPDFANRMDVVLRLHDSRRDVPDGVVEEMASASSDGAGAESVAKPAEQSPISAPPTATKGKKATADAAPTLNPAGLYKREGEEALVTALASQKLSALRAIVAEHNLDPSGVTPSLTHDELAAHIVAQAKKRSARDEKMFDY